jgi:hypothetical protein
MSASAMGPVAWASMYAFARRTGAGSARAGRPAASASVKVDGKVEKERAHLLLDQRRAFG